MPSIIAFTKEELVGSLQKEVRILAHLAGKVDRSMLDYRPTPKQRSTLELLQYMAIMGPTLVAIIKAGTFTREAFGSAWGPAEAAAKAMNFDQAVSAIEAQSEEYRRLLSNWTDADFRGEIDMFGTPSTRGSLLVNLILGGYAAYRTQLFCYLKACGLEQLNTMNLWAGLDGPA
jgi:hypothetical protein